MELRFSPSVADAIRIHDAIIKASGGLDGIRDPGLLESLMNRPHTAYFGVERYKSLHMKSAVLLEGIALYHPFVDGNKRTSMAVADLFLTFNGMPLEFTNEEYESFILEVVRDRMSIRRVAGWLAQHSRAGEV